MAKLNNIFKHKKVLIYLGLYVFVVLLLELLIFNWGFVYSRFNGLEERHYSVKDGALFQFSLENGTLIAQTNDPNITINNINIPLYYISIDCRNANPKALGQLFYRSTGENFSESNSIIYNFLYQNKTFHLPEIQTVNSLRFDLTDIPGDIITCREFVVNPKIPLNSSPYRIAIYMGLLLFSILFCFKNISPINKIYLDIKEIITVSFSETLHKRMAWFLCVFLIGIDLSYPLLLSYDSGSYLMLSDVIQRGAWSQWNPIRGIIFPLTLESFKVLFGTNQNAFLIPMTLAHLVLFVLSCYFIMHSSQFKDHVAKEVTVIIIFLFIALDPLILGFYHTLLTEFLATTIAIISCYGAYHLYQKLIQLPTFSSTTLFWTAFFVLMVPFSWHLKQPYIGIAYFPFIVSCLLMFFYKPTKAKILYFILANSLVVLAVAISMLAWNAFLRKNDVSLERSSIPLMENNINKYIELYRQSPVAFGKDIVKRYLASCNYFYYDQLADKIIKVPSLTRAVENAQYGTRMFDNYGNTNYTGPDIFLPYTYLFITEYQPPVWISEIEQAMVIKSYFFFTATYLLLPLFVIMSTILWFRRKDLKISLILILSVSSLLNGLMNIFVLPIDRYLWWGYPLNLIICVILLIEGIRKLDPRAIASKLRQKWLSDEVVAKAKKRIGAIEQYSGKVKDARVERT